MSFIPAAIAALSLVVVFAAVFEFPQSLADSFVGEREMCIRDSSTALRQTKLKIS